MIISKKVSDASTRVLETLKVLTKDSASIQDIIRHFEKIDANNKIYTNEVILKYINTLKVFGFRFVKEKDKYTLLNNLEKINLDENDLKAIFIIEELAGLFPEDRTKVEIYRFLLELEKNLSDSTRILSNKIHKDLFLNSNPSYEKHIQKIKEYEKYCADEQRVKITYINQNKTETSCIVEPNEIRYDEDELYFSVYNPLSAQVQDINFNSIVKIEQLPLKSNPNTMLSSVTFKLKGRLSNAYKLHEGEKLQDKIDNSIIIINQKEDRALLLKRLMKYGENCEVISPKSFREDMKKLIQKTINNYL